LAGTDRLAGSALNMAAGVTNLMRLAGLPLTDAVRMATRNPAAAAHIAGRQNGITPGDRADLIAFAENGGAIEIETTWVSGERVHQR
jgi:N-acetylglucosamine-6-phosphate deacetylase